MIAGAEPQPTAILEGRHAGPELRADADVVIVGSGASGAVAAKILAEAGRSVIVLEEGGHIAPESYGRFRPSQTLEQMFRDGGMTAAVGIGDTPLISVLCGRTVGGSSTLTGGVIFRIPEAVHHSWAVDHGLHELGPGRLDAAYEDVERELNVETVPEEHRSRSTQLFAEGAKRLGFEVKPMRRNTRGCRGSSRCNFGCPHRAKRSVDLTYLVKARRQGAQVISDCKVTRILVEGDRAVGVEGQLLDAEGHARGRITVRAARVVIAGSALFTPILLQRAGVGRWTRQVGRNLTLHPAARVAALFDQDVSGWRGAMQSAYADAFEEDGLTLNSMFAPPGVMAAMMPGVGAELRHYTRQMANLASFGLMVHDAGGGRVWRLPGGRPLFTYRMASRDKQRLIRGIKILAETFFAAGAREVLLPVFGSRPLRSADDLRVLDTLPARRIECATFHPLGTARMGHDPVNSVVKPSGETHDVRGLYVVDGSVFPSSIGVNSQLPIMAVATKLAWGMVGAT